MNYNLYISPCPNDTFSFYALINGLIDTQDLSFEIHYEDIDTLNKRAISSNYNSSNYSTDVDIIKISCATLGLVQESYKLLSSGAALGYGNAPIVVCSEERVLNNDLSGNLVAIPGEHTTANNLLKKFFPNVKTAVTLFSDIAKMVSSGVVDAGVLIHEGRFTYRSQGLKLFADMGEIWESQFNLPIPLGCIVANKHIPPNHIYTIELLIRQSVLYALSNPNEPLSFVRHYAQELDADVLQKHISYFVNKFTIDLGEQGRKAIEMINTY